MGGRWLDLSSIGEDTMGGEVSKSEPVVSFRYLLVGISSMSESSPTTVVVIE